MDKEKRKRKKKIKRLKEIVIFLGIVIAGLVAFATDFGELWCKVFTDSSWCQEEDSPKPVKLPEPKPVIPPSVTEQAIELLTRKNPAGLKIEILPSPTLKVGKAMKMRLRSDHDGYLIVLDINKEGELTTLFPNKYSDQRQQGYLKVGQSLIIPDAYYGFDFEVHKQTQGILVAILVEGDLTVVREVLPVPFEGIKESYAIGILQQLRQQLDKTVPNEKGIEESIRWSGIKAEYKITDVP